MFSDDMNTSRDRIFRSSQEGQKNIQFQKVTKFKFFSFQVDILVFPEDGLTGFEFQGSWTLREKNYVCPVRRFHFRFFLHDHG